MEINNDNLFEAAYVVLKYLEGYASDMRYPEREFVSKVGEYVIRFSSLGQPLTTNQIAASVAAHHSHPTGPMPLGKLSERWYCTTCKIRFSNHKDKQKHYYYEHGYGAKVRGSLPKDEATDWRSGPRTWSIVRCPVCKAKMSSAAMGAHVKYQHPKKETQLEGKRKLAPAHAAKLRDILEKARAAKAARKNLKEIQKEQAA